MTPERWQRIEPLYQEALARPRADRQAFLAAACADDEAMRREVESLLPESASDDGFLAKPLLSMSPYAVTAIERAAMAGTALGGYQLHPLLGVGGMGEVYQAHEMFADGSDAEGEEGLYKIPVDGGPPVGLVTGETRRLTEASHRSHGPQLPEYVRCHS